jgi:two-component system, OmpR family, KDP operon response regulator KdpE
MGAAQILVVDDEPAILRTLRSNLAARGYEVVTAETGEEAMRSASTEPPDLVILDLMLPGLSGLEVCEALRADLNCPILVLSAHGEERLKVRALDLGADDYLTKPFGMGELLARVRALLRRQPSMPDKASVLTVGEFHVDLNTHQATCAGTPLNLTRRELEVLSFLLRHAGRVVTHTMLLEDVWGPEYEAETQYVRVFINRLRQRIEDDPSHPRHILTVPGVGYRLEPGPSDVEPDPAGAR